MWIELDVDIERRRDETNRGIELAWRINQMFAMAWSGKLPKLNDLLIGETPASDQRQTGTQIAASLRALAGMYGVAVTKEPRPKHGG